jgi:flavin reductase (DIM6/NTAB) family NADH-FMN oxidoreductase RutF
MMRKARRLVKRALLGPTDTAQKFHIGLHDPQSEVDVWLHGWGDRIDVTHRHLMACGAPLTIGIGFESGQIESAKSYRRLTLRFHEHAGEQRLLGEIGLHVDSSLSVGTQEIYLFHVTDYRNHCLPWIRLWMHYLLHERTRRQSKDDVRITSRDSLAMIVFYLCPRPIALVTVGDLEVGNLFPMNLMGPIGGDYFAFGLNSNRAAPLVERARTIVLSTVPLEQASLVSSLGKNHRKASIDWSKLAFPTIRPRNIDAPVPSFALSACEMQIEEFRHLGSHTLFVAKKLAEERLADGPQLFLAHGMYKAWLHHSKRTVDCGTEGGGSTATIGQHRLPALPSDGTQMR